MLLWSLLFHLAGRRAVDSRQPSDEEYDTGDNASYISTDSTDVQSISGAAEGGEYDISAALLNVSIQP